MKSRGEPLLNDVLAESSPPDFRAVLLDETLRCARQRRHRRQLRRAAGILGVAMVAGMLAWQNRPMNIARAHPGGKVPTPMSYQLVETQPLRSAAVIITGTVGGAKTVSSGMRVAEVASGAGGFRFINDEQLLALAAPQAAMLVRTGPESEALVFAIAEPPSDLVGRRHTN